MKDNLNEVEISKIEQFCADEAMYNAVEKALFAILYSDGVVSKDSNLVKTNGAFALIANAYSENKNISNDDLGAQLRAKFEGVHTILDGFAKLKTLKQTPQVVESTHNKAI